MRKGLKVVGIALVGVGLFAAGSLTGEKTGASTDWMTNAINTANSEIGSAGYQKKTEIVTNADADINAKIMSEVQSEVDAKELELQALLEQYYQMKLNGLTDTPEYATILSQIETIQQGVFDRYKAEIDAVFATQ